MDEVRRTALRSEEAGLAPGRRRRTPGPRRKEVARLSNVGVTRHTWLEQGRDVHSLPEILAALAHALRLDRAAAWPDDHEVTHRGTGITAVIGYPGTGTRDRRRSGSRR